MPCLFSCNTVHGPQSGAVLLGHISALVHRLVVILYYHLLGAVLQVDTLHLHHRLDAVLHGPIHATGGEQLNLERSVQRIKDLQDVTHLAGQLCDVHAVRRPDDLARLLEGCAAHLPLLHVVIPRPVVLQGPAEVVMLPCRQAHHHQD